MPQISPHMLELLERIDDLAVGGSHVTPGIESYSNLKVLRNPMDLEKWTTWEGVHFNPSARQIKAMASSFKTIRFQSDFDDIVGQMDFDFYDKNGTPKEKNPPTWQQVIANMKEEEVPLPFCVVPSGTPGNFHMLWVLDKPKPRGYFQLGKDILRYWGADSNFTNSLSRNPEYRVHNPNSAGEVTHWWDEWTDKVEVVHNFDELGGVGYHTCVDDSYSVRPMFDEARLMKKRRARDQKERMSYPKLLTRMSGAVDGDGRFHLLCAYTRRNLASFLRVNGRVALPQEVREILAAGNAMFSDPVSPRRTEYIARYWKVTRQQDFLSSQYRKGMQNFKARESRLETMAFYFSLLDTRDALRSFLDGEDTLTDDLRQRVLTYTGKKLHRGLIVNAFLAHVMGMYTEEWIDQETGEVFEPALDVRRVSNLLRNGPVRKYSREELAEGYARLQADIDAKNAIAKKDVVAEVKGGALTTESSAPVDSSLNDNGYCAVDANVGPFEEALSYSPKICKIRNLTGHSTMDMIRALANPQESKTTERLEACPS